MQIVEALLYKICRKILVLLHYKNGEEGADTVAQFLKFGIVGVSNTAISYALNAGTLKVLEPFSVAWDYIAGNCIAFLLSVLWSFYWNSRFVFHKEHHGRSVVEKRLLKSYIAYGFTGIVLNNILSWFWVKQLEISKYVAPLINSVISVPLNYFINKFWAFQ